MISLIHVTSSLKLGGAERFVIDLAGIQRECHIDASILSLGEDDDILLGEAQRKHIPVQTHSGARGRRLAFPPIYRLFKSADLIQVHSPYALQYLLPLLISLPSKKVIYTRHGEGVTELRWKLFYWLAEPFIDLATFVSSSAQQNFSKRYRWAAHKLLTVENGVYVPQARSAERGPAYPIRFGSIGRMVGLKGQGHLLNAIDMIDAHEPGNRFELHFFGSGPLENTLKQQAASSTNAASIFFHGTVIDRDAIYDAIDVLVVSSESEGLSLVILEAMARGIPVIATAVGGNVSLVEPDVSGYLVNYGDATSMLSALQAFISRPGKIAVFGQSARKLVVERYSLERTHKAYLQCYAGLRGGGAALHHPAGR